MTEYQELIVTCILAYFSSTLRIGLDGPVRGGL